MKQELRNKATQISNKLERISDLEMQLDEISSLGEKAGYMSIYTNNDIQDFIDIIVAKIQFAEEELEELMEGVQ